MDERVKQLLSQLNPAELAKLELKLTKQSFNNAPETFVTRHYVCNSCKSDFIDEVSSYRYNDYSKIIFVRSCKHCPSFFAKLDPVLLGQIIYELLTYGKIRSNY